MNRRFNMSISFLMIAVFVLSMIACNTASMGNQLLTPDKAISSDVGELSSNVISWITNLPITDIPTVTPTTNPPTDTPTQTPVATTTPTTTEIPTVTPPATTSQPLFKFVQFRPTEKLVAITFDDGPSYNTPKILDKIEGTDSKVTFFVVGNRLRSQEWASGTKRAISLGCEIGFHSWDHEDASSYDKLSDAALAEQISKTNELIHALGGNDVTLLRPTGGTSIKTKDYGYPLILWMGDTEDWRTYSKYSKKEISYEEAVTEVTNAIVRDATKNGGGNIVLMHDLYNTSAEAFCRAYDILTEQGYKFVTVSELLDIQNKNVSGYTFYSTYAAYYLGDRCSNA